MSDLRANSSQWRTLIGLGVDLSCFDALFEINLVVFFKKKAQYSIPTSTIDIFANIS